MRSSWSDFNRNTRDSVFGIIFILVAIGCGVGGGVLAANGEAICVLPFILAVIFFIVAISFFKGSKAKPSTTTETNTYKKPEPVLTNDEKAESEYKKSDQKIISKKVGIAYRMTIKKNSWEEEMTEKEFKQIVGIIFADKIRDRSFTSDSYRTISTMFLDGKTIVTDDGFKDSVLKFDVGYDLIGSLTKAAIVIGHINRMIELSKHRKEMYDKGISLNFDLNYDSQDLIERYSWKKYIAADIENVLKNPPSEEDKALIREIKDSLNGEDEEPRTDGKYDA